MMDLYDECTVTICRNSWGHCDIEVTSHEVKRKGPNINRSLSSYTGIFLQDPKTLNFVLIRKVTNCSPCYNMVHIVRRMVQS